jgi:pimeloyl-ACP methyl ester carboxylesterase
LFVDHHEGTSGERIVLVHGAMDRSTSFATVRRILSHHTTIAYDRRGYARSLSVGPAQSLQDHIDDLHGVLDNQPSVVVGHSYGGVVALAVADQYPELIRALVIYEAPMPWTDWWPSDAGGSTIEAGRVGGPAAAAESFMRRIVGDRVWEKLGEETRAARRAEGEALLFDLQGLRGSGCPFNVDRIECPVAIGFGETSVAHQQRSSHELHALLLSGLLSGRAQQRPNPPGLLLREFPATGHGAHAGAAKLFAALVEDAMAL